VDVDWLKLGPLLLGGAGTLLGIYNLLVARQDRRQKTKHGFALMLLSLDPIVDKLLGIPLNQPSDLETIETAPLLHALSEVDEAVDKGQKELISLVPEIAGRILNLRYATNVLRRKLTDPATCSPDLVRAATDLMHAAWTLAHFRSFARSFEIDLHGQSEPSPQNWTGDAKVQSLNARWEAFFLASRRSDA
jgi:hypothetical protein